MKKELLDKIIEIFRDAERKAADILAMVEADVTAESSVAQDWMSPLQLAKYWQLSNPKGEPTTGGIWKWTRRKPDEFPLPHAYMGDLLRFHREDVDRWANEEAERRRVEKEGKRSKFA